MRLSRYVGELITDLKLDTHSSGYTSNALSRQGIDEESFLRYLNYAQQSLERHITSVYPRAFGFQKTFNIVGGAREIKLPDNVFLGLRIESVEYSYDGNGENYSYLNKGLFSDSMSVQGYPAGWARYNNSLMLSPPPKYTKGKIRVTYQRHLDSMALRTSVVGSGTVSGGNLTALAVSGGITALTGASLSSPIFLCLNDNIGNVNAYNIAITGYDTGSGVLTFAPTPIENNITTVGGSDFVTIGQYTTTHSKLPFTCEQYLIEYAGRRVKTRDNSAQEMQALDMHAQRLVKEIVEAYAQSDNISAQLIPMGEYASSMMMIPRRIR